MTRNPGIVNFLTGWGRVNGSRKTSEVLKTATVTIAESNLRCAARGATLTTKHICARTLTGNVCQVVFKLYMKHILLYIVMKTLLTSYRGIPAVPLCAGGTINMWHVDW